MAKFSMLQGLPSGLARRIAPKDEPGSAGAPRRKAKQSDSAGMGGSTPRPGQPTEPKKGTPKRIKKWRAANKEKLAAYQRKWRKRRAAEKEKK